MRGSLGLVNLNANYTLSKCMTDRTNVGVSNPGQTFHRGRDRQHCAGDRRHLLNMTGVFNAPELGDGVLRTLAENWRLAAIYRFTSGAPHSVTAGSDRALNGLAGQVVDQVSDDYVQDDSGELGSQYLNRAAFALPALGDARQHGLQRVPRLRVLDVRHRGLTHLRRRGHRSGSSCASRRSTC